MHVLALAVATCLGVGYVPLAPGTFGSAAGVLLWWWLPSSAGSQLAVIAAIMGAGTWSAGVAEQYFFGADPGQVVIDEVMGMLITLWLVPVGWAGAFVGFILFRLFDVIKPYPANRLEAVHGGLGVMADDAMAGVYANLTLRLTVVLASSLGWSL